MPSTASRSTSSAGIRHLPGPERLRQDDHAPDDRGFETPTGGTIELGGHDLALSKPYERNIGGVPNYACSAHDGGEGVVFPLKMRRFPRKDMRARRARCSSSWA
jgi:hypothetical protein